MTVELLPVRLSPGDDLRGAIETAVQRSGVSSAFVVSGIGSLADPRLRLANQPSESWFSGAFELVSLNGSIAANGSHLHMSIAGEAGAVLGGHVVYGNAVRTTAEVLLMLLPQWHLLREHDPHTGFQELRVRRSE